MPDPSYPCNRHFVSAAEGKAVLLPMPAAQATLSAQRRQGAERTGVQRTRGVLLASPSNPTGTSIAPGRVAQHPCRGAPTRRHHPGRRDLPGLQLSTTQFGHTALAIDDQIISINSFSKYFNMTGWRLGWMVVPEALVPVIERLAAEPLHLPQHALPQHAALACFEPESLALYEARRAAFKARRDYFIPALDAMGLTRAGGCPMARFTRGPTARRLCQTGSQGAAGSSRSK